MAKKSKTLKIGDQFRAGNISLETRASEGDEKQEVYEISISSETPVERWFGNEILDHARDSVDLNWLNSGNAPLLLDHDRTQQIGVVKNARLVDKRLVGEVRFSKGARAQEIKQDVADDIRSNISVGYRYHDEMKLEEETDGVATYRVDRWAPFEVSIVSIPADQTVGVGRAETDEKREIKIINQTIIEERKDVMPESVKEEVRENDAQKAVVSAEEMRSIQTKAGELAAKDEAVRTKEILALGDVHRQPDKAVDFLREGKSVEDFRTHVIDNPNTGKGDVQARGGKLGLTDAEAKKFSFLRAMDALESGDWSKAGFEREVSNAAAKEFGRNADHITVPSDVLLRDISKANTGANLIATDFRPGNFIDLLRNKMMVRQLGATILGGLEGDVEIPRKATGTSAAFFGDGSDAVESNFTIGNTNLAAKSIGTYVDSTRKMRLQSSIDVERLAEDDIITALALGIDLAALYGSGTGENPEGLVNATGVGSITFAGAVPTFGELVDMESEIAAANADINTMKYLTDAAMRGALKQTAVESGHPEKVWANNELNGYGAHASNQVTGGDVLFGDWSQVLVGEWGVVTLKKSEEALLLSGGVRIVAMQDVDIAVRQPSAFCVGNDGV